MTNVEPGLPLIDGDHHQLSQVFTNLLTNAFEALDGKGRITISAATTAIEADPAFAGIHPPTPAVLVEVADDGPGHPGGADRSDLQSVLHDQGHRAPGLGLAIVRKIVDAHDGRIDVSSTPDAGTRFRVTLPVSSASGWFK